MADTPATDSKPEEPKYNPGLKTWHVPLRRDSMTLREAYETLMAIGNSQDEVPLMVKLVENPKYHFGGLGFFKGRVTLRQHDFIHIVLGRGTAMIDEAFTIGFTMGSTDRVSTTEQSIFTWIAGKLYPKPYRFKDEQLRVMRDAVALAYVSDCEPLCGVDFEPLLDLPLREVRERIRLEKDLLEAYYRIEMRRNPKNYASQRLLVE